jgi:hypothetical protein
VYSGMRKLIIQIPCFNEEETLPAILADILFWLVRYLLR